MNALPHALAHALPHGVVFATPSATVHAKTREGKGRDHTTQQVTTPHFSMAEFQDQRLLSQGSRRVIGFGGPTC